MTTWKYSKYFGKKTNRKIKLLYYLMEKSYSKNKLANYIQCSSKTVLSDLKEIEEDMFFLLNRQLNLKNDELKNVSPLVVHKLICKYVEESIEYSVLCFFLSLESNIPFFLKKNHIGYSSFYTAYYKIEQAVQDEGFQLKNKKYIKGDELGIRFFFFSLFWDIFKGVVWPFKNISEVSVLEEVADYLNLNKIYLSEYEKKKLSFLLAICILRKQNDECLIVPKLLNKFVIEHTQLEQPLKEHKNILLLYIYTLPFTSMQEQDVTSLLADRLSLFEISVDNFKKHVENIIPQELCVKFYLSVVKILYLEEHVSFGTLKHEISFFYYQFLGAGDWELEEKKLVEGFKYNNFLLWLLNKLTLEKIPIHINTIYGERFEKIIRELLLVGVDRSIEWIDSSCDENTIVITDQFEFFEKNRNVYFLRVPLTQETINGFQNMCRNFF